MPEALDQLVLPLLQLERSTRPNSAADVMERLSGIAGLSRAELPEVRRMLGMLVLRGDASNRH